MAIADHTDLAAYCLDERSMRARYPHSLGSFVAIKRLPGFGAVRLCCENDRVNWLLQTT